MNTPIAVLPHEIDTVWDEILPLLDAACEYNGGRYSANDYLSDLRESDKQLWLVRNDGMLRAVVVTAIVNFPLKRCCSIDICTGEGLAEWGHLTQIIEHWAKSLGCDAMFLTARPGMERLLSALHYRKTHAIFEKNLT